MAKQLHLKPKSSVVNITCVKSAIHVISEASSSSSSSCNVSIKIKNKNKNKKHQHNHAHEKLNVISWNIRTLSSSTSSEFKTVSKKKVPEKIPFLSHEFESCHVDIACLQEVRRLHSDVSPLERDGYVFHFSGHPTTRREGVAIVVRKDWMRCIHQVECVSPRMMWLSGCFSGQNIVFISLYAPTNVYSSSDKCAFYDFVNEHLRKIPDKYQQIICGDMNARIGPLVGGTWGDVRGKYHCYGSIQNENGLLMLEFCQRNRLRICNSLFHQKNYGTWKHPRSKQYHTLDYCLVANRLSPLVQKCMIVREMDCWSDHIAVMTTLRLHRKKRFIVDCTVSDKSVAKIDYSVLSSNKRLRKELGSLIDQGIGNIEKGSSKDYRILNDIIK